VLKLTKNGKSPREYSIISELLMYAPDEFKIRLLQFLKNICTKNCIPNAWRNATVISIFKKDERRDPKNLQKY
jgi:hypothetical protein